MLNIFERELLEFEATHLTQTAYKNDLIRDTFKISPTTYYRMLMAVLATPAAVAEFPQLANVHRRRREARDARRRTRVEQRASSARRAA